MSSALFERRITVRKALTWYTIAGVIACAMCLYLGFMAGQYITYISANCSGFHVKHY